MELNLEGSSNVRDLSPLLMDVDGRLRVVDAHILEATTPEERFVFGVRHGIYSFPTTELRDFLCARIRGRTAIEIGAGHGALARALAIPATDNRQQEEPLFRAHYKRLGQATVPYGAHVEKLDAVSAVQRHRPQVVISCWVTHLFDARHEAAGGSVFGVDEAAVIASCDEYIVVGNEMIHAQKPIWRLPHEKLTPPWLYSRAVNGSAEFVAIWRREQLRSGA